jgi:hypothetical protein
MTKSDKLIFIVGFSIHIIGCSGNTGENRSIIKNESSVKSPTIEKTASYQTSENKSPVLKTKIDNSKSIKEADIGYISQGQLFLYDIEKRENIKIKMLNNVFQFAFNRKNQTIYYTTANKTDSLFLMKAEMKNDSIIIYEISDLKLNKSEFITDTYGNKSDFILLNDTLYIEYNFVWQGFFFDSLICMDLNKELVNKIPNQWSHKSSKLERIAKNPNLTVLKTGNNSELYITNQTKKVKLSHTEQLNEHLYEMEEKDFDTYKFSPDSTKIIFSVIYAMGDLPHGSYFIVDINGENQMELNIDLARAIIPEWVGKNQLIYTEYNENGSSFDLIMTDPRINTSIKIAKDIDFFSIIK